MGNDGDGSDQAKIISFLAGLEKQDYQFLFSRIGAKHDLR
jgi:hypothetical protein